MSEREWAGGREVMVGWARSGWASGNGSWDCGQPQKRRKQERHDLMCTRKCSFQSCVEAGGPERKKANEEGYTVTHMREADNQTGDATREVRAVWDFGPREDQQDTLKGGVGGKGKVP